MQIASYKLFDVCVLFFCFCSFLFFFPCCFCLFFVIAIMLHLLPMSSLLALSFVALLRHIAFISCLAILPCPTISLCALLFHFMPCCLSTPYCFALCLVVLSCLVVSLCALLFLHALLFCLVPYCFALLCSFTLYHTLLAFMLLCVAPHLVISFHDLLLHLALFHFKLHPCYFPSYLVVSISPIAPPCLVTFFHTLFLRLTLLL